VDILIKTTAKTPQEGIALFQTMGMPFSEKKKK